ncbi:hypothetical protein E6P09_17605 (plasmid) [Haloferax mediterranei ATCC 33500]|uniref:Uncharacterized protein n=1 Tax=Haloferax mediterranei (strain ATCC 33500 / DSM 1411 / JCM 8866 / NBRC 14739 / NCIMB 2177 / R-4) TaxID=523841 RepID=I3R9R5_HALMT|nr:hypothetical protein [Haloferax mediterranei]AFK20975.1 hypothetical protein HFX_5141 [Haloferax mediterranei ATCC 33500]AHZ24161.1 hypothetical protein BM92_18325 [Haloferax mediterranei ATCC 33500]MDX5989958.1 hypothetical protein [Haloferax mediterranei ATCC 33500]QCQ77146.1 hypothetical protein E6P09_17605 [Haloferax mediterranei ATCC 33500]
MNTAESVTVTPLTRVVSDDADVAVRRVETPKGVRLELDATRSEARVRLDAVTLECLSWQERSTFVGFLEPQLRPLSSDVLVVQQNPDDGESTEIAHITNEFGHVEVRTAERAESAWLELVATKLGFVTRLNAVALESITWQDQDTFTELLRQRLEEPKK